MQGSRTSAEATWKRTILRPKVRLDSTQLCSGTIQPLTRGPKLLVGMPTHRTARAGAADICRNLTVQAQLTNDSGRDHFVVLAPGSKGGVTKASRESYSAGYL